MNNLLRLVVGGALVALAVLLIGLGMARNTAALTAPLNLLLTLILIGIYFLPTALALYRDCEATVWITLLNILLGWTLFGWVIAVGWAASGKASAMPATIGPHGPTLQGH
jgi:hypothetical protein